MRLHVSYGGGNNSVALLCGLHERGIRPDAITFADTGGEKPHTYDHMRRIMPPWLEASGFPPITELRADSPQQRIDGTLEQECLRLGNLPSKAYGLSSCSDKWKIRPQNAFDYRTAEELGIPLSDITRLIGFHRDEPGRVAKGIEANKLQPVQRAFPLFDWGWASEECEEAIARNGLPLPGKSACFYCPSSKKHEIVDLMKRYPDLYARAVAMERRAVAGEGTTARTTGAGLGRSFAWEFVQEPWICVAGVPEMDCGCYDG